MATPGPPNPNPNPPTLTHPRPHPNPNSNPRTLTRWAACGHPTQNPNPNPNPNPNLNPKPLSLSLIKSKPNPNQVGGMWLPNRLLFSGSAAGAEWPLPAPWPVAVISSATGFVRWRRSSHFCRHPRPAATTSACLRSRPLGSQPHALRHATTAGQKSSPFARCSLQRAARHSCDMTHTTASPRSCFSF